MYISVHWARNDTFSHYYIIIYIRLSVDEKKEWFSQRVWANSFFCFFSSKPLESKSTAFWPFASPSSLTLRTWLGTLLSRTSFSSLTTPAPSSASTLARTSLSIRSMPTPLPPRLSPSREQGSLMDSRLGVHFQYGFFCNNLKVLVASHASSFYSSRPKVAGLLITTSLDKSAKVELWDYFGPKTDIVIIHYKVLWFYYHL